MSNQDTNIDVQKSTSPSQEKEYENQSNETDSLDDTQNKDPHQSPLDNPVVQRSAEENIDTVHDAQNDNLSLYGEVSSAVQDDQLCENSTVQNINSSTNVQTQFTEDSSIIQDSDSIDGTPNPPNENNLVVTDGESSKERNEELLQLTEDSSVIQDPDHVEQNTNSTQEVQNDGTSQFTEDVSIVPVNLEHAGAANESSDYTQDVDINTPCQFIGSNSSIQAVNKKTTSAKNATIRGTNKRTNTLPKHCSLKIDGLPKKYRVRELKELLFKLGLKFKDVRVPPNSVSHRYTNIRFLSEQERNIARSKLNGYWWKGSRLRAKNLNDSANDIEDNFIVQDERRPEHSAVQNIDPAKEGNIWFAMKLGRLPETYGIKALRELLLSQTGAKVNIKSGQRISLSVTVRFRSDKERKNAVKILNGYIWMGAKLLAEEVTDTSAEELQNNKSRPVGKNNDNEHEEEEKDNDSIFDEENIDPLRFIEENFIVQDEQWYGDPDEEDIDSKVEAQDIIPLQSSQVNSSLQDIVPLESSDDKSAQQDIVQLQSSEDNFALQDIVPLQLSEDNSALQDIVPLQTSGDNSALQDKELSINPPEQNTDSTHEDKELSIDPPVQNTDSTHEANNDGPSQSIESSGVVSNLFSLKILKLPKNYDMNEFKEMFINRLGLKIVDVKSPFPESPTVADFKSNEDRNHAMKVFNGYKWKGRMLQAKKLVPMKRKRIMSPDQQIPAKRVKLDEKPNYNVYLALKQNVTPYWDLDYENQLKLKHKSIESTLRKLGDDLEIAHRIKSGKSKGGKSKISKWLEMQRNLYSGIPCNLLHFWYSEETNGWCKSCKFKVGRNSRTGEITVGMLVGKKVHYNIVGISALRHIPGHIKAVVKHFRDFVTTSSIEVFNGTQGYLEEFIVRAATSQLMLCVGLHNDNAPLTEEIKQFLKGFVGYFADGPGKILKVTSMYYQVLLGKREPTPVQLWGDQYLTEKLLGLTLKVSPNVFFQRNRKSAKILYEAIRELSAATSLSTIIDVGCGMGITALHLARESKQVFGIDHSMEAVSCANENVKINNITNCEFFHGSAEVRMAELCNKAKGDVIAIIHPTLHGFENSFMATLRRLGKIKRIVYVATHPKAAYRNFLDLSGGQTVDVPGEPFLPTKTIAVDLAPYTTNWELVMCFERWSIICRQY